MRLAQHHLLRCLGFAYSVRSAKRNLDSETTLGCRKRGGRVAGTTNHPGNLATQTSCNRRINDLLQVSSTVARRFDLKNVRWRLVPESPRHASLQLGAMILWPTEMQSTTTGSRAILAHEIAHLRRRDHWAVWLELIADVLWWWNPACYFIRRRLHETRESACDAAYARSHRRSTSRLCSKHNRSNDGSIN